MFGSATKCSYDAYQFMVEPPQRPSAGAMGIDTPEVFRKKHFFPESGYLKKKPKPTAPSHIAYNPLHVGASLGY